MQDNNNFVLDSEGVRKLRFDSLKDRIEEYSSILNLPADLLNWALNAQDEYNSYASDLYNAESDYKDARYYSKVANKSLLDMYQKCKFILVSKFKKDKKMALLGIEGASPRQYRDLASAADTMLKGIADLIAQGFTDVIPEIFRTELEQKLLDANDKFYQIGVMEEKLARERQIYKERFDSDTKNLRILYSYIIAQKGKTYFDLPVLGFAIDNKKRGRKRKRKEKDAEVDSKDVG